jgi:hypothetical protein
MDTLPDDDKGKALHRAVISITGAVTDVARWLAPDEVTSTALTLAQAVHAMMLASRAKATARASLDQIVALSNGHTAELAQFYFDKLLRGVTQTEINELAAELRKDFPA